MDPSCLVPSGSAQQQMLQQQAVHQQALHRQALQQPGLHQGVLQPGGQSQSLPTNPFRAGGVQQSGVNQANGPGPSSQGQPAVRGTREGGFADLNAEPPASDGEADGPVPSDSTPSAVNMAQQDNNRASPPEEKKKRKKATKEAQVVREGEDIKKAGKPTKSRAKPRGESSEAGVDGDMDSQVTGIPTTREEKLKSLKAGLMHVARKLPKNALAQFFLGLMFQRLGQPSKAAAAYEKSAEILKQTEEETGQGRAQLLSVVQIHQAQCLLHSNFMTQLGNSGTELRKEELDGVTTKVREGLQADNGQTSLWNTMGLLLLRTGRLQSAVAVFLAILSVVPDCADALANLGVAYMQSGEFPNAIRCFQAVLEKDKTHPGALLNYGALLVHQYGSSFAGAGARAGSGGYEDVYSMQHTAALAAQQCLVSSLKDDPKAGHAWVNLAAAYAASGCILEANKCLEQASKLEPSRMSTRYAVAAQRVRDAERLDDSTEQSEQLGWAANEMASTLRDGDSSIQTHIAWAGLAMVNRAQHETAASFEGGGVDLKEVEERAIHSLQQAIEEDPHNAVPWHQLGLHTLCTLQFGPAQKYLKSAIARRHNCPVSWSNLGIALHFSEDPSVAEGVYKQALALASPEQVHTVLSNLGNLYRQQKRFSDAHAVYKKALELCPDYAPASNNLGLLYVAEGNWDLAIASFDRALSSDPYFEAARSNKMKAEALALTGKAGQTASGPPTTQPPDSAPVQVLQAETTAPPDGSAQLSSVSLRNQPPQPRLSAQPTPQLVEASQPTQQLPQSLQAIQRSSQAASSPQLSQPIHQGTQLGQFSFPSSLSSLAGPQLAPSSSSLTPLVPPAIASKASVARQPQQREPFPLPSIS